MTMIKNFLSSGVNLPKIGRVTIVEIFLIIFYSVTSVLTGWIAVVMSPMFDGIFMPGSGGTAQMILLTFLGPIYFFMLVLAFSGVVLAVRLLNKIHERSINKKAYLK